MKHVPGSAERKLLLFAVFVLSLCGITYELVLGSLAAYLLGNPLQQYSITIGFFMVSMGAGSYLSRFITHNLVRSFISIEIALGVAGGVSVLALNYLFSFEASYYLIHVFFTVLIGAFVGLEVPLLTRILRESGPLKNILSNVLSLDYLGGLAGALLFPLVLFPYTGRIITSIVMGIVNVAIAAVLVARLSYPGKRRIDIALPVVCLGLLVCMLVFSAEMNRFLQKRLYFDDIVLTKRTRFQEIVLTRNGDDFRLYLDGSLQFSTYDEYRYHEMLVFPAMTMCASPRKDVLVMGGGDGLAVRDVLRCPGVGAVTLVELDAEMIRLAKTNSSFRRINRDSLLDPRVRVIVADAFGYLRGNTRSYDVIIADFPDPHDETISKLYSEEMFRMVKRSLKKHGVFVTQSTSPLSARESFWCVNATMKLVFGAATPYHLYVPTFGDWGFNLASCAPPGAGISPAHVDGARYYSPEAFRQSLFFPGDSANLPVRINTLNAPVLYTYYLRAWRHMDF